MNNYPTTQPNFEPNSAPCTQLELLPVPTIQPESVTVQIEPMPEDQTDDLPFELYESEFQFYPTPDSVIRQLVRPYYNQHGLALEPSAGRGDIVAALTHHGLQVNCCEISPDLRAILISKGYKVIGTDFLAMQAPYLFNLIVMNPPFAKCADHVLKAWSMLLPDGEIASVLPKTAIGKTKGKYAELNQIIDLFGKVEEIGSAFKDAARPTDVECVIVRIKKPAGKKFTPFENFNPTMDEPLESPEDKDLPAPRDLIKSIVAQYKAAMLALRTAYEAEQVFYNLAPVSAYQFESKIDYAGRIELTKKAFWDLIFERTKIGEKLTSNFREQFYAEQAKLSMMEFSEETIYEVLHRFVQNKDAIFEQCVMDLFTQITRYSRDNIYQGEQWATNKGHKIGVKIIVPYGVEYERDFHISYHHYRQNFLNDLDKVLSLFGGTNGTSTLKGIEATLAMINKGTIDYDGKFETPNFYFKVHKKGTLHLWFRDTAALEMINRYAAERNMFVLGSGK